MHGPYLRPPPKLWPGASNAQRAIHREYRRRWRVRRALIAEDANGFYGPKNDRERLFCAIFVRQSIALVKNRKLTNAAVREAGAVAVREAGYREKRERAVNTRAEEMLSLPRIQRGIAEVYAAAGVDVAKIATVFAEILNAPLEEVAAGDKLKCAELFFKTTHGFAPAKAANVNTNVTVDAFFDPGEFATAPPIKTVTK